MIVPSFGFIVFIYSENQTKHTNTVSLLISCLLSQLLATFISYLASHSVINRY
jgi:RsiW-degrading membrane proteinase PrsW (M82 family)